MNSYLHEFWSTDCLKFKSTWGLCHRYVTPRYTSHNINVNKRCENLGPKCVFHNFLISKRQYSNRTCFRKRNNIGRKAKNSDRFSFIGNMYVSRSRCVQTTSITNPWFRTRWIFTGFVLVGIRIICKNIGNLSWHICETFLFWSSSLSERSLGCAS